MNNILKRVSQDVHLKDIGQLNNDDIFEILQILRPGCRFDMEFKDGDIEYRHFWHPDNLSAPTIEEINVEIDYQKKCKEYYTYAYDRCREYPDGFEQFDMLWHAINNSIELQSSEWFQTIKAIKEKYPKPAGIPPVNENK